MDSHLLRSPRLKSDNNNYFAYDVLMPFTQPSQQVVSSPPLAPLSAPAVLGLMLCLVALGLQIWTALALGQPRIGETVMASPALSLGVAVIALLALTYWQRDWLSSPLRAGFAAFVGALVALLILSAPHLTITKAQESQGSETMNMQNVVLIPGPAAWNGTVVVGNGIVRSPNSSDSQKGEGIVTTQMDTSSSGNSFWLALLIAPLVAVAYQQIISKKVAPIRNSD